MGRVLPVVVAIALLIYALIDCLQTDTARFRSLNRIAWIAIIVLIPLVGPVLWLIIGKARARPQPTAPPRRPLAPDDDPEFLRQLRDIDGQHEKMLNQWEADLRRREEEIQRRKDAEQRAAAERAAAEELERQKQAERRKREDEAHQHTDDEDDSR